MVLVALQITTLGKTPFGELRRSWLAVILGIILALIGITSCILPGVLANGIVIISGVMLLCGGFALFLQLFLDKLKAKLWLAGSQELRLLTFSVAIFYFLCVLTGIITIFPGFLPLWSSAVVLLVFSVSILFFSWSLWKVQKLYNCGIPSKKNAADGFFLLRDADLPYTSSILLVLGVFIFYLGLVLFPVNAGIFGFSSDGQYGVLLTIMAIQMLAMGNTSVGSFKRTGLFMLISIVFAVSGIVSCITPGLLTAYLGILLGVLNIASGGRYFIMLIFTGGNPSGANMEMPKILKRLYLIQILNNIVSILFGIGMLLPALLPAYFTAGVLLINGFLLVKLALVLADINALEVAVNKQ